MVDGWAMDVRPIGWVSSTRTEPFDDDWGAVASSVVFDPAEVSPDALAGLDQFSHVEIVYVFDRVDPDQVERGARHPRGNPAWPKVGILAQRAKNRPNRLGLSRSRIVSVDGLTLHLLDLDAVDGTPILDVKPWMAEFGPRGPVRQPGWSADLMAGYW